MNLKCFNRLGIIFLALFSVFQAAGQTTYSFTTSGPPFNQYAVNGTTLATEHLNGGSSYTLTINVSHPLFLTVDATRSTSSQNYYAVNPGAFSSSAMSTPTTSATVVFTPPVSNSVYNIYYVDATSGSVDSGTLEIDPPVTLPDTTSLVLISRPIVPTNGPATVTVVPRNSGNVVNTSSSIFTMSVSAGGGTITGLSPGSGTNFTASYTAGTNTGTFSISDGFGGSVAVSVIKFLPFSSLTLSNAHSGQSFLTGHGYSNLICQVTASTNLISWSNFGPVTSSPAGLLQFTDAFTPYPSKRFYRIAYP